MLTSLIARYSKFDVNLFLRGGFWLTGVQIVTLFGGLITTVLFTHLLTPSEYGVYKYIIGIGVLISSFSLTGITQSIMQASMKETHGFFNYAMRQSFLYATGTTCISLLLAGFYFYKDNEVLAMGCLLIAVAQPLISNYQNINFFLLGKKQFKLVTLSQAIKTLIVTTASVLVLLVTQNILILFATYLFSQVIVYFVFHQIYQPKEGDDAKPGTLQQYMSYARHTSLRNLISNVAYRIDNVLVFTHLGATELAIYAIANIIPDQIKATFKNLSTLLLSKFVLHGNLRGIRGNILSRSGLLFLILCAIMIGYILIAPFLYSFLFPQYHDAILLTQLAALSFPAFVALIPSSALQAQLQERELYLINLFSSVLQLVLVVILIYSSGLLGAIFARVASRYINLLLTYYFFFHSSK